MRNEKIRKRKSEEPVYRLDGTILPSAVDAEEAVLGAIILESDAIAVDSILPKKECFYALQNQHIYSAILDLRQNGNPIDILTVTQKLKEKNLLEVVTPYYVAQLTSKVASSANVEYHARIVAQKYIEREMLLFSEKFKQDIRSGEFDVFELHDKAIDNLEVISQTVAKKQTQSFRELLNDANKDLINSQPNTEVITGINTGIYDLNKRHGGWQNNNFIVIGARPAMGKTALTLSMAIKQAKSGNRVGIFSLEMSASQLIKRIIASETGIDFEKIKTKNLSNFEKQKVDAHVHEIENAPLIIEDSAPLNINQIRSIAKLWKAKFDIEIIYIDYLQLITNSDKSNNREQEVSKISRSLKLLAKELNIPVICLAQLSRTVESRQDKHPLLSDLRESGAIEQDADIVIFLYRAEYYQEVDEIERGKLEICTAKFRDGEVGIDYAKFIAKTQQIFDWNYTNELNSFAENNKSITTRKIEPKNFYETEKTQDAPPF